MKKVYLFFTYLFAITILFSSCTEEDNIGDSLINVENIEESNEIDMWIKDNFTDPYNIEIKWRYEEDEFAGWDYSPSKERAVIPFLTALLDYGVKPLERVAGREFVVRNMPRQFYLIGSNAYLENGAIAQGTAEGGKKVIMMNVNGILKENIDFKDDLGNPAQNRRDSVLAVKEVLRLSLHTFYHEFAHICHQNQMYNEKEWIKFSPGKYTQNWSQETWYWYDGFITDYAQSMPKEDFVEHFSEYITWNPNVESGYVTHIEGINAKDPSERTDDDRWFLEGNKTIVAKLDFVGAYFKKTWGLSMNELKKTFTKEMEDFDEIY